jgi:SAM-dependent methyltransferase
MFNIYGEYYDLFYQEKDYKQETDYIIDLLSKHKILNGNILEFGSGTGKHGCLLGESGFTVHGIELSNEMVVRAKKHPKFICQQGDIAKVRINKSFDAVISLFHVISYQTTDNQIKAVFENASNHLTNDGLFIFDIWYSPAVNYKKPSVRVKRVKNNKYSIIRIAEPQCYPNNNLVDVEYTFFVKKLDDNLITQFEEHHSLRHFSISEIDELAQLYDFKRVDAQEFITKKNPSRDTWGICITLKKN